MITGRPISWSRGEDTMCWYDFACKFVDMKWKGTAPRWPPC
jgi:hypothetical protein